jgi:hypothetical protein
MFCPIPTAVTNNTKFYTPQRLVTNTNSCYKNKVSAAPFLISETKAMNHQDFVDLENPVIL